MREDSAEKSAREGLVGYAAPVAPKAKDCGCPMIGCTVECLRRKRGLTFDNYKRVEVRD